jgi:hypothetical protein
MAGGERVLAFGEQLTYLAVHHFADHGPKSYARPGASPR